MITKIIILVLILFIIIYLSIKINNNFKKANFSNMDLQFLHIPKNAGTSIENEALKYNLNFGKFYFINEIYPKEFKYYNDYHIINNLDNIKTQAPWHIPPSLFDKNVYKNKILFCVVRDPFDRLISIYKYRNKNKLDKHDDNILSIDEWIQETLGKIENIDYKKLFKKLDKYKLNYEISIIFFENNLFLKMFDKNFYEKIKFYLRKKNNFLIIFSKK